MCTWPHCFEVGSLSPSPRVCHCWLAILRGLGQAAKIQIQIEAEKIQIQIQIEAAKIQIQIQIGAAKIQIQATQN